MRVSVIRVAPNASGVFQDDFEAYTVAVCSNGDRELMVTCRDDEDVLICAAMYARGGWVRVQMEQPPADGAQVGRWQKWQRYQDHAGFGGVFV